jgi:hypothetical protein
VHGEVSEHVEKENSSLLEPEPEPEPPSMGGMGMSEVAQRPPTQNCPLGHAKDAEQVCVVLL